MLIEKKLFPFFMQYSFSKLGLVFYRQSNCIQILNFKDLYGLNVFFWTNWTPHSRTKEEENNLNGFAFNKKHRQIALFAIESATNLIIVVCMNTKKHSVYTHHRHLLLLVFCWCYCSGFAFNKWTNKQRRNI